MTFPAANNDDGVVVAVAIEPSGRRLATGRTSLRVTVVEMNSRRHLWTSNLRPNHFSGDPLLLSFSPDGRSLAAVGSRVFLIVDAATGAVTADLTPKSSFDYEGRTAAWGVDSRWIVGPGDGRTLQLWDLEAQRQSYQWSLEQWHAVGCASFSPDGRYLLMGRADRQLGIIDLSTGQGVSEIKSAVGISTCAITPDWRVLVTRGDGYLQIWRRK